MDPLAEWLQEKTVSSADAWSPTAALFASYQEWAKGSGETSPLGKKSFSQHMAGTFAALNRGPKGGRGFRGVGLLTGHQVLTISPIEHEITLGDKLDTENASFFENELRVGKNYDLSVNNTSSVNQAPEFSSADTICSECHQSVPDTEVFKYGPPLVCISCADMDLEEF
jgi:hypothetical protein